MSDKKIYWDEVNGKVTDDNTRALILNSKKDIYIETYEVWDKTHTRMNFAYTKSEKMNSNINIKRREYFRKFGLQDFNIGKLLRWSVPDDVYKELWNRVWGD